MSALLATRFDDRVEMASDGGTFDQFGVLVAKRTKILAAPSVPLAVGGCGGNEEINALSQFIIAKAEASGVDAAIEELGEALPDRYEVTSPVPFEIVIGCTSEKDGPQIWRFRSLRLGDTALPALRYEWRGDVSLGPDLSLEDMQQAGYWPEDFKRTAIAWMHAMRAKKSRPEFYGEIAEAHWIGGHVDHAVITPAGVQIERVVEWPDVVGELVSI